MNVQIFYLPNNYPVCLVGCHLYITLFAWVFSDLALFFRAETAPVIDGFLLLKQLQPSCYQYREGREYCILHHVQSGSFSDVFCVQDKRTGFQCAAKKVRMLLHILYILYIYMFMPQAIHIFWKDTDFSLFSSDQVPLNRFSSEEVSTWSALDSARVVELFGAVREGLNVVLFMDLKPGELFIGTATTTMQSWAD